MARDRYNIIAHSTIAITFFYKSPQKPSGGIAEGKKCMDDGDGENYVLLCRCESLCIHGNDDKEMETPNHVYSATGSRDSPESSALMCQSKKQEMCCCQ